MKKRNIKSTKSNTLNHKTRLLNKNNTSFLQCNFVIISKNVKLIFYRQLYDK